MYLLLSLKEKAITLKGQNSWKFAKSNNNLFLQFCWESFKAEILAACSISIPLVVFSLSLSLSLTHTHTHTHSSLFSFSFSSFGTILLFIQKVITFGPIFILCNWETHFHSFIADDRTTRKSSIYFSSPIILLINGNCILGSTKKKDN